MKTDAGGVVNWFVLHNTVADSALAYRIQKAEHSIEIFPRKSLIITVSGIQVKYLQMNMMVVEILFTIWCHTNVWTSKETKEVA